MAGSPGRAARSRLRGTNEGNGTTVAISCAETCQHVPIPNATHVLHGFTKLTLKRTCSCAVIGVTARSPVGSSWAQHPSHGCAINTIQGYLWRHLSAFNIAPIVQRWLRWPTHSGPCSLCSDFVADAELLSRGVDFPS